MKLVLNLILIFANLHILRTNYHLKDTSTQCLYFLDIIRKKYKKRTFTVLN